MIILIFIIVFLLSIVVKSDNCELYLTLTPNRGRSVFAGRNYTNGETVDWGPALTFPMFESLLNYYVYESEEEEHYMLIMGSASMLFNHRVPGDVDHEWVVASEDIPSIEMQVSDSNTIFDEGIKHVANRDITYGDEIFFDYGGDEWFTDRNFSDYSSTIRYNLKEFDDSARFCISNVRISESTIDYAGLGLFTQVSMKQGDTTAISAAAPVPWDDVVDTTSESVLINYAISSGDPNEEFLTVPLGPITYANHGGKSKANVELRYFDLRSGQVTRLPTKSFTEVVDGTYTPNDIVLVALRDIDEGEELLLDYGEEWENAWEEYVEALDDSDHYIACNELDDEGEEEEEEKEQKKEQDDEVCFADIHSLPQLRMPIIAQYIHDHPIDINTTEL